MAVSIQQSTNVNWIQFKEQSGAPSVPATGLMRIYPTSAGMFYLNSSGTLIQFMDTLGLINALKTPPPIGGITPNSGVFTTLSVSAGLTSSGADALFEIEGLPLNMRYDVYVGSAGGTSHIGRKARGSKSVPAAVQANDLLANFGGIGWDNTGSWPTISASRFYMYATETHSSTAHGAAIKFDTTPNGSTTRLNRVTLDQNGLLVVGQNMPDQFPVGLYISESTHASSRRASFQLGTNWICMVDSQGNGTKDFGFYSGVQNLMTVFCDVNGVPRFQGLNVATAAVFTAEAHNATSTGTPAVGFGGAADYIAQSASVYDRNVARLTWEWVVATDATRKGKAKLWAGDAAAWRECISWASDGSVAQLGLYGAVPVGRPTYGAPTGTPTRTTFDTTTVTLPQLAERVKAMIDDLHSVGMFA